MQYIMLLTSYTFFHRARENKVSDMTCNYVFLKEISGAADM